MSQAAIWIKNPLAIFAQDSDGGIVIKGQKIIELVPFSFSMVQSLFTPKRKNSLI